MKKLALTLLASAVLTFPAVAQQQPSGSPQGINSQQQQSMSPEQHGQISPRQQGQTSPRELAQISPRSLNKQQIRHIQQSLNQKGFSTGHVDGIWGRHTAEALENFRKSQGMQADGALDRQTLSDLGVNVAQAKPRSQHMKMGRSVSSRASRNQSKTRKRYPSSSSAHGQMNGTNQNQTNGQQSQ